MGAGRKAGGRGFAFGVDVVTRWDALTAGPFLVEQRLLGWLSGVSAVGLGHFVGTGMGSTRAWPLRRGHQSEAAGCSLQ